MPRKKSANDKAPSVEQDSDKRTKARRDWKAGHDPLTSRPKATKHADETYPIKLTQPQRESMIHATRTRNKLKERLIEAGEGTQSVGFTLKELTYLNNELGEAALFAPGPDKKRLVTVLHQVTDLLSKEQADVFKDVAPTLRKTAPRQGDPLYQFRITLLDIKPPIWRRIQVPDCTLADLHDYIQAVFGWEDYHLHQFDIDGDRYGPLADDDFGFGDETVDETEVRLSTLIPKSGRKSRWIYEYDFGDGWRHEILFEGFPTPDPKAKYPLCIDGKRAGPPEDCGGPHGYPDFLAGLADPQHERHEERMEWGGPFDPEAFDARQATREMRNEN